MLASQIVLGILPGEGEAGWPDVLTTLITSVFSLLIMCGGFWLIRELWKIVFDVIRDSDTEKVHAIKSLLGTVEITRGQKVSAIGTGLLGTILILGFCLGAVVYGLDFTYG